MASTSSSGFPENSGLKFDQFICKCLCPATSCGWGCSCPCLELVQLLLLLYLSSFCLIFILAVFLFLCVIYSSHMLTCLYIPDMINLLWYTYYYQNSTHPRCLNLMIPEIYPMDNCILLYKLEHFSYLLNFQPQNLDLPTI